MEKYQCKICYRTFANGKALGGHNRSHLFNLPIPPKQPRPPSPSPSSNSEELFYELRENPKKSFRIADPLFSFGGCSNSNTTVASSFVVQDRESETESSKNVKNVPTHRRRSNLTRPKSEYKVARFCQTPDPEPVSSISGDSFTTTEEEVARCLMKLSTGKWTYQGEKSEDDGVDSEDLKGNKNKNHLKGRYRCETCQKSFKSYQALGGHKGSHMKIKVCDDNCNNNFSSPSKAEGKAVVPRIRTHECPICLRVFSTGQALGGHKRSHLLNQNRSPVPTKISSSDSSLFDLNLPAPMEDDPEFEFSAVSDAEFVSQFPW